MHDPIDFHTTNTVLNQYSDVRDPLVVSFFVRAQCAALRLLLRLKGDHARQAKTLKATILRQDASFWQHILGFVGDPFVMCFPCVGRAQEDDAPTRIHNHHIFDGMLFLLAAVVDFLLIAVFGSCYWSFRSILAKKGGASGSNGVVSACNSAANSAALRAGSKL